jgi:hypothetical protein
VSCWEKWKACEKWYQNIPMEYSKYSIVRHSVNRKSKSGRRSGRAGKFETKADCTKMKQLLKSDAIKRAEVLGTRKDE